MAAMNDSTVPRKRTATYGKAYRKRPQDYTSSAAFFEASLKDEGTTSIEKVLATDVADTTMKTVVSPPTIARQATTNDIYEFVSDDERPSLTPQKKQRVGKSAPLPRVASASRKPQLGAAVSTGRGAGQQQPAPGIASMIQKARHPTKAVAIPSHPDPKSQTHVVSKLSGIGKPSRPLLQSSPRVVSKGSEQSTKRIESSLKTAASTGAMVKPSQPYIPNNQGVLNARSGATISLKNSPTPGATVLSTPATPPGLSPRSKLQSTSPRSTNGVLTPRIMGMWNDLLGQDDDIEGSVDSKYTSPQRQRSQTPQIPRSAMQPPRRRLIDSLVEQSNGVKPGIDTSDSEDEQMHDVTATAPIMQTAVFPAQSSSDVHDPKSARRAPVKQLDVANQIPQATANKVTYSQQRSMLAEQIVSDKMAFEMPLHDSQSSGQGQRRGSIPTLAPLPSFHEADDEEESQIGSGIKTVHELRQSGANSRFVDEVGDLLDQIGGPGSPLSLRRSGLLDLATKMYEKEFHSKFMFLGMDQRLFVHLGKESDAVSGFLIVSILLKVLENGITAISISQLRRQGITRLLIRLLDIDSAILRVAKDRKSNMSKVAQSMLLEHHTTMLKTRMWSDMKPSSISPRTAALRCLEAMVRQIREAGNSSDIISKELTTKLFDIVNMPMNEEGSYFLDFLRNVDFRLALSTLELHSLKATTGSDESLWIEDFLPIIRDILKATMKFPISECGAQQVLALRLTLNVTNNNPGASDVFADKKLMQEIGQVMVEKFKLLSGFLVEEEQVPLLDHLVLMLGVVINFAEWSSRARECFDVNEEDSNDPVNALVQICVGNLDRMAEADSMEDIQRNIAFGYLSIFLGYLCLIPNIGTRIRRGLRSGSLRPLVASIEEFISHHKKVDDLWDDDAEGHNPNAGLTERLQEMVDKLKTA